MISTNETLLDRLKAENAHEAWQEFYRLYWGAILRYARKLGLSEHQAEEVLQETMVALIRILPEFAYDQRKGRFRNFLLTIVHRKALVALRRIKRESAERDSEVELPEAADPVTSRSGSEGSRALGLWRESLLEEALRRLRDDPTLGDRTFAVFHAYVVDQRAASAVATEFGIKENAVYQIKNRVLRRLRQEMHLLMRTSGAK